MAKTIIFDFDGTLADTGALYYEVYLKLAKENGIVQFTPEQVEELRLVSVKQRLKAAKVKFYRFPGLVNKALKMYEELIESAHMFEGVEEELIALKEQNAHMSIVSSNNSTNIKKFLKVHGLEFFEHISGRASVFNKQHAIRKHIRKLGLEKENIVYVGDELRDIVACKKLGIKVVAVTWGYDHVELLQTGNPDYMITKPSELGQIINEN
ncbi:MAG: HAD-IA family hydrolase [Clostridia bacterium]|nr:HAD-IA family hydrolase [Clostridia bacterium]